jgi:hypothetical protein
MTENSCTSDPEGCSIGRDVMPYGHSHPPRVRPVLVPLCLKLGLCLCIKPAKSVSRICESASSRQSSSTLPCYRRACFRQAALCCPYIPTRRWRSLRLCCFEPAKRSRLALQPTFPSLTLLDILGGVESALTGAYTLSRAAAGTIVHCCFHAVFANQLARLRRFWFLASAFCQASACDSVQLVHSDDNRHFLCPCSCEDPPSARQIAHDQHSLLTSFAFCTAIFSFRRARCFSSSRFDSLQHISGFLS